MQVVGTAGKFKYVRPGGSLSISSFQTREEAEEIGAKMEALMDEEYLTKILGLRKDDPRNAAVFAKYPLKKVEKVKAKVKYRFGWFVVGEG